MYHPSLMLRVRLGMTQEEVAKRMGIRRERVAEMEKDPTRVSFEKVARYAHALGARFELVEPAAPESGKGRSGGTKTGLSKTGGVKTRGKEKREAVRSKPANA